MILRVHLVPCFGRMKLDAINNLDIEKYKAQKLAPGYPPRQSITIWRL